MFAANLYKNLGVPDSVEFSIRVIHKGLSGRTLASSNPSRILGIPRSATENECTTESIVELGKVSDTLVEVVQRLTAPLFMLFDFQEFQDKIYSDIVRRFEKGETT